MSDDWVSISLFRPPTLHRVRACSHVVGEFEGVLTRVYDDKYEWLVSDDKGNTFSKYTYEGTSWKSINESE